MKEEQLAQYNLLLVNLKWTQLLLVDYIGAHQRRLCLRLHRS
nr:hypothetical protein [Salmonella enterica]